jgi:hypothetical protein
MVKRPDYLEREPRWPAVLAVLALGLLHAVLPSSLSLGPDWLLFAIVTVLLLPTAVFHRRGLHSHNQWFGSIILAFITADIIVSLALLIANVVARRLPARTLLLSAGGLWLSNLLVFACWYWRLDAGGPHQRARHGAHTRGAFLFPQMVLDPKLEAAAGQQHWTPGFVDYLFLAFNTSTAFSPTDVPVLSRWAKLMMMVQALISLATLVIVAARAVNVL